MPILRMKVARPPSPRPLFLYDGQCSFCRRGAFRMRGLTRRQVDFASYHLAAHHFPEIDKKYFAEEVKLIAPTGHVYGGAEAIYKALSYAGRGYGWLFWLYEVLPPFRWVSEMVYRRIAARRAIYSSRLGPFWAEWDSGGERYEVDTRPDRRRQVQKDRR